MQVRRRLSQHQSWQTKASPWSMELACQAAPCNITNSNQRPGHDCQCQDAYIGKISWNGSKASGICSPARSLQRARLKQKTWAGLQVQGEHFAGDIWWHGSSSEGKCEAVRCAANHKARKRAPCRCVDGYEGKFNSTVTFGRRRYTSPELRGRCSKAQCTVPNSTFVAGRSCRCQDGYKGRIRWEGSQASGSCSQAPCNLPNTNMAAGIACRCKDGYEGMVTWNGPTPTANCRPVECTIANSDLVPGPSCKCNTGWVGKIVWRETSAFGTCVLAPACSQDVVFMMIPELADKNRSRFAQRQLFAGFRCAGTTKLKWSAAPVPSLSPAAGVHCDNLDHSSTPLPSFLPKHCVKVQADNLRCAPYMRYATTTKEANITCNHGRLGDVFHLEFQGRICGYDRIQWDVVAVRSMSLSGSGVDVLCQRNLSVGCGTAPHPGVPTVCYWYSQDAVFRSQSQKVDLRLASDGWFYLEGEGIPAEMQQRTEHVVKSWHYSGEYFLLVWSFHTSMLAPITMALRVDRTDTELELSTFDDVTFRMTAPCPQWLSNAYQAQQQSMDPAIFAVEALFGCNFSSSIGSTRYNITIGQVINVAVADSHLCIKHSPGCMTGTEYWFRSSGPSESLSGIGIQRYRSKHRDAQCHVAAFSEMSLEVWHLSGQDKPDCAAMSLPCRHLLRCTVDVGKFLQICGTDYRDLWHHHIWKAAVGTDVEE
ncbi:unnamed protein product [Effrenium voratum]|uniref:Uncharacterized protein n=1 Tax=Effrenium voratum TaxID=2562239 RepID=A0AA36HXJ8_9DINO|nr:unnamed protein product [Effrenium voratum]